MESWLTRVALVDDDESVRRALGRLLRVDGLTADLFSSAQSFLEGLAADGYGCVILDIHLGGMSGLDLLERLGTERHRLPVILITAFDDEASRERAQAGGAFAYLRKPIDAGILLETVRKAMGATGRTGPGP